MVERTMTRWGVGPWFLAWSLVASIPLLCFRVWGPAWTRLDLVPGVWRTVVGALLVSAGLLLWVPALVQLHTGFTDGRLVTGGAYGICRHPIYAAWAVLIVPGVGVLANTWLSIVLGAAMAAMLRALVRDEEQWLARRFGPSHSAYCALVPAVLPIGWLRRAPEPEPPAARPPGGSP